MAIHLYLVPPSMAIHQQLIQNEHKTPPLFQVTFTKQPYNNLRKRFPYLTSNGFDLLMGLLTYDPKKRITAEQALDHSYFKVRMTAEQALDHSYFKVDSVC